jgi:DNA-binding transcriptional LysR family regulator
MEMQLLRCFVAVGEELHISNAADRLRVAAPTLSEAIQRLEYGLGLRLFVRLRHGVTLTPAGHALLPVARRVLTEFDEGVHAARIAEAQAAQVLRVGYACRMAPALITAITAEFQRRRREWRLEMRRAEPADPMATSGDEAEDGYGDEARDGGGNAVTLLRLPVPADGDGGLEGRLEGTVSTRGSAAEPFSLEPYGAGPYRSGEWDTARPEMAGTLREFLLTSGHPADRGAQPGSDVLDVGDWFGPVVAHQAIGIVTETAVTGPPGSDVRDVRDVKIAAPSVFSAVWPRGGADPVIADFLQACITAVHDHAARKGT